MRGKGKPAGTVAKARAEGPQHGSIAFSQENDGGYAWGIAWRFGSRANATEEAIEQCRREGGTECAEAGWFRDACGALAIGDENGYGAGWGHTKRDAEADALAQCRAANDNCRLEVARCSRSEEAGGSGRTDKACNRGRGKFDSRPRRQRHFTCKCLARAGTEVRRWRFLALLERILQQARMPCFPHTAPNYVFGRK